MKKKFVKRDSTRFSKFGKRRKKLLSWRKPKGRDNKMREKRKGYPVVVSIGYKSSKNAVKDEIIINNILDLNRVKKGKIIKVGRIGKKKKIEIAKKAKEMKIKLKNINVESFLKKIEKKENKENKK